MAALLGRIDPFDPDQEEWPQYVECLDQYVECLDQSEVMQRFLFNSRSRRTEESVADHLAALRRLAEHCNCGDTLEKILRDRLVWGISDVGWALLL